MAVSYGSGSFKTVTELKETKADASDLTEDELISRNIQKISHNVLQIKNMVQKIGTSLDSEDLRHRMSILQGETNQLTKATNTALKAVSGTNKTTESNEQDKLKIKIRLLREKFHDVLQDYQETQKTAKIKQRDTIRFKLRDSVIQEEESKARNGSQEEVSSELLQIEVVKEEVDLELVKEREEALKQLERDILDINSIFKDLAVMVHDQGKDIDKIEENVEQAAEDIEDGVKDLEKAEGYQSSSRRKTLFLVLILAAVIVVVIIIIVVVVTQTTK